jgi:hypothetical protein
MAFKTKSIANRFDFTVGWHLAPHQLRNQNHNVHIRFLIQTYLFFSELLLAKQGQVLFFTSILRKQHWKTSINKIVPSALIKWTHKPLAIPYLKQANLQRDILIAVHHYKRRSKYEKFTQLETTDRTLFRIFNSAKGWQPNWLSSTNVDFRKRIRDEFWLRMTRDELVYAKKKGLYMPEHIPFWKDHSPFYLYLIKNLVIIKTLLSQINKNEKFNNFIITEPILLHADLNFNELIRITRSLHRYKKLQYFLSTLKVVYLTRFYKNPYILASHLRFLILLERRHKKILYNVSNLLKIHKLFNKHLSGITIKLIGRVNRATRARKFVLTIGDALDLYTFKTVITYAYIEAFAKIGSFGIHVWIKISRSILTANIEYVKRLKIGLRKNKTLLQNFGFVLKSK